MPVLTLIITGEQISSKIDLHTLVKTRIRKETLLTATLIEKLL